MMWMSRRGGGGSRRGEERRGEERRRGRREAWYLRLALIFLSFFLFLFFSFLSLPDRDRADGNSFLPLSFFLFFFPTSSFAFSICPFALYVYSRHSLARSPPPHPLPAMTQPRNGRPPRCAGGGQSRGGCLSACLAAAAAAWK